MWKTRLVITLLYPVVACFKTIERYFFNEFWLFTTVLLLLFGHIDFSVTDKLLRDESIDGQRGGTSVLSVWSVGQIQVSWLWSGYVWTLFKESSQVGKGFTFLIRKYLGDCFLISLFVYLIAPSWSHYYSKLSYNFPVSLLFMVFIDWGEWILECLLDHSRLVKRSLFGNAEAEALMCKGGSLLLLSGWIVCVWCIGCCQHYYCWDEMK